MLRGLFIVFLILFSKCFMSQTVAYHVGIKSIAINQDLISQPAYKNFGLGFYVGNIDTLPKMFFLRSKAGIEYENVNIKTFYNTTPATYLDSNKYNQNISSFNLFLSLGTRFQPKKKVNVPFFATGVNAKIYFASFSRVQQNSTFSARGFKLSNGEFFTLNDYLSIGLKTSKREFTLNFENFIFNTFSSGLYYYNDDKRYHLKSINLIIKI